MTTGEHVSVSQPSPPDGNVRGSDARRLATRWWRRWTALYFTLLTVGTHWPALSISVGEGPPPDKVMHLFAFGGLTLLLWQCRLLTNKWLLGLIVAAWVVLDEITQSLPILRRESNWMDIAAGLAGVACAIAWIWATAPVKKCVSYHRRRMFDDLINMQLSTLHGRMELALGIAVTALAAAAATYGMLLFIVIAADSINTSIIAMFIGAVFGLHFVFYEWWRQRFPARHRRTFTWLNSFAAGWVYSLAGIIGLVAGTLVLMKYGYSPQDVPESLQVVSQVGRAILITSMFVRGARQQWAKHIEDQWNHCISCGYDMSGHTVIDQQAVCPECGAPFARWNDPSGR